MDLNDAIAHCEEKAEEQRRWATSLEKESIERAACLECAHEHEQLADWLRELKERRENDEKEYSRGYADGCAAGYAEGKEEGVREFKTHWHKVTKRGKKYAQCPLCHAEWEFFKSNEFDIKYYNEEMKGKEGLLSCEGCKYGDNGIFEPCETCVRGKIDQYEKEEKP